MCNLIGDSGGALESMTDHSLYGESNIDEKWLQQK